MSPTDQVRALLLAKADALVGRDTETLRALLHADFLYVNASGTRFDKKSYIETFCLTGKVAFIEQSISELDVRSFTGFAVATMILHDRFHANGVEVGAAYRSLCVFSELGNRWQWAAGQSMVFN